MYMYNYCTLFTILQNLSPLYLPFSIRGDSIISGNGKTNFWFCKIIHVKKTDKYVYDAKKKSDCMRLENFINKWECLSKLVELVSEAPHYHDYPNVSWHDRWIIPSSQIPYQRNKNTIFYRKLKVTFDQRVFSHLTKIIFRVFDCPLKTGFTVLLKLNMASELSDISHLYKA